MFNTDIDYGKLVEGIQVTWLGLSYKMLLAIMLFLPSFRLTGKDAPLPARSPHPAAPRDHPCRRHDLVVPRLLPTLTRHFPLRHTDGRDRLTQMPRSTWFGAQPVGEGRGGWPVAEGRGAQPGTEGREGWPVAEGRMPLVSVYVCVQVCVHAAVVMHRHRHRHR